MVHRSCMSILALALAASLGVAAAAEAQIGGLIRRATRTASDELQREIDRLVREGVRCAFHDEACIRRARESGKTPVMTDDNGNLITDGDGKPMTDPALAAAKAGSPGRPGAGVWANYDFVPGERVVFFDDYSADNVGDFPRRFDLLAGNWEVVESAGQRFIRATGAGAIRLDLPETLPERFTLEFPVSISHGNAYLRVTPAPYHQGNRKYAGSAVTFRTTQAGLMAIGNQGPEVMTRKRDSVRGDVRVTLRVMADGEHMKMYLDDHRVANAPNAVFPRTNTLFFTVESVAEDYPAMIGPMRIAAGGLDLYDRLEADGRVAVQGIYFAVNSDVIRPESTGTLKEIGTMLKQHPQLRLSIEGHTDTDGEDAYNLDLSQRRARAVKAHLVQSFGVEAARLEAAGLGETKPVADNTTPEGKPLNRRVELVKIGG